jgi:hypothetical protein
LALSPSAQIERSDAASNHGLARPGSFFIRREVWYSHIRSYVKINPQN